LPWPPTVRESSNAEALTVAASNAATAIVLIVRERIALSFQIAEAEITIGRYARSILFPLRLAARGPHSDSPLFFSPRLRYCAPCTLVRQSPPLPSPHPRQASSRHLD